MSTNISNQSKELSPAVKLAKQIKKEHFIKTILWASGVFFTVCWLAFTIATSINPSTHVVWMGNEKPLTSIEEITEWAKAGYDLKVIRDKNGDFVRIVMDMVKFRKSDNPLCLTYDPTLTGWYMCVLLAPVGYLGIIYIIAYMKNMITPGAIKKTVRKALQFNYLKQKDVDYVVDEIDYNIGIKFRPEEEPNGERQQETNLEDIFTETPR